MRWDGALTDLEWLWTFIFQQQKLKKQNIEQNKQTALSSLVRSFVRSFVHINSIKRRSAQAHNRIGVVFISSAIKRSFRSLALVLRLFVVLVPTFSVGLSLPGSAVRFCAAVLRLSVFVPSFFAGTFYFFSLSLFVGIKGTVMMIAAVNAFFTALGVTALVSQFRCHLVDILSFFSFI